MSLCPFFKETCKGNQCMMWKNESCLFTNFLQYSETLDEPIDSGPPSIYVAEPETKIPEYFELVSSEDIAKEFLEFLKKELPDSIDRHSLYEMFNPFLHSKGLQNVYSLPNEINLKIEKARIFAERAIEKEHQQKVLSEKSAIPNLVDLCVDWARANGLRNLRKSDLETFLMEKEYEITNETERAVYSIANTKLKSKK